MAKATADKALKTAIKEALTEVLQELRGVFRELFVEALEDLAMKNAINEGLKTKRTTRDNVLRALRSRA
jgi:hypothetical protein